MEKKIPKRAESLKEYQWRLEDLYQTEEMWEEEYELLSSEIEELSSYQGNLLKDCETLLSFLNKRDSSGIKLERIYVYANQHLHEDTADAHYQKMAGKAQSIMTAYYSATAFMTPELLEGSYTLLESYMQECEELNVYKHFFEELFREKAHTLSQKEEELLAASGEMAEGPRDIYGMFNNADLKFPAAKDKDDMAHEVTHGTYISLLESRDRELRKNAFASVYTTYGSFKNMLAALFKANIKQETFYAKVRGYDSSLHAALFGSAVPQTVYDNLIESVHEFFPSMHRYMELRKKALGVEELHMYDLYVPMIADADMNIPFEDAKAIVKKGLEPLGKDYLDILQEGYDNGWIDVYENEGKRSGAYSWGAFGTHPYVLMNYKDNLNSVFTLAHEMGHAIHSYYSDKNQPYIYAGYRIFVAEVASTCNEALLIRHLIDRAKDKKEKAYLINYFLEQFKGTIYRQTMFAEFEKIMHAMEERKEAISADTLCDIYGELNKAYFGENVCVDKEIEMEWARIPHFYTPFYVYQYATGFSAAIALSDKILKEGESAAEDYKKFLKGGSSMDPIELLKLAGVDMADPMPVKNALMVFDKYVSELNELLK